MIQLYTNIITEIRNNTPNILDNISVYLMEDYQFNADDTLANIELLKISSAPLLNIKVLRLTNNIILDADDITIPTGYNKQNTVTGIIFCNDTKPLFYSEYEGLPLNLNSKSLNISFSNSKNKILNVSSTVEYGNVIFSQNGFKTSTPEPDFIERNNLPVSYAEDIDKSRFTGKFSSYKDISITARPHPLTGDIVTVSDKAAINQSLKNILLANKYDRPFSSIDIAGNLNAFLFDFADTVTVAEIKSGIAIAINNYERRINLINISVYNPKNTYSLQIIIEYSIKTTNDTYEFKFLLDRA